MSEWYSDLPAEELTGKHVRVLLDGGSVLEGRLVFDEKIGYARLDAPQLEVPVYNDTKLQAPLFSLLFETEDGIWYPLMGIESITLVWDEREWEQIDPSEASRGDAVVVNGRVWDITDQVHAAVLDKETMLLGWSVGSFDGLDGLDGFVYRSMVSCALRRKGATDGV